MPIKLPDMPELLSALAGAEQRAQAAAKAASDEANIDAFRVAEFGKTVQEFMPPGFQVRTKRGLRGLEFVITPPRRS